MLLYTILILGLNFNIVFNLRGKYESICFEDLYRVQIRNIVKYIPRERCCEGYVLRGNTCEPHCDPPCINSACIAPNRCGCTDANRLNCLPCPAGYKGADCTELCTDNTYGENCENRCECEHGLCDPESGECFCHGDWFGPTCSEACECQNGATCDSLTGLCLCPLGFTGDYCELPCDDDHWGYNCLQQCDCDEYTCDKKDGSCIFECTCKKSTTESCDPQIGRCLCHEGWTGDKCENRVPCPPMMYGPTCENTCKCEKDHHSSCHQDTGKCSCLPGWYGETCNKTCVCENGACDKEGDCVCKPGWLGKTCNKICVCENGSCDKEGNCHCQPGWQGESCNIKCNDGFYGKACREKCPDAWENGNYFCHHIKGPTCKGGYTGINCTSYCPEGTFGIDCKPCNCRNFVGCDRITGECDCYPGWYGPTCEKMCPHNYYGEKCKQTCPEICPNCRKRDGYCPCQPGWKGRDCEEYCPAEYIDANTRQCVELAEDLKLDNNLDKTDLVKIDFDKMDLNKTDLVKIDFDKMDLDKTDFVKIGFDKMDLDKTDLVKIDFDKMDLDKTDFVKIDLDKTDLVKIDLDETDVEKTDLYKTGLNKTDISDITLYYYIGAAIAVILVFVTICAVTFRVLLKKKTKSKGRRFSDVHQAQEEMNEEEEYEDRADSPIYETIPGDIYNNPYNTLIHIPMEPGYLPPRDIAQPSNDNYIPTKRPPSFRAPPDPAAYLSAAVANEEYERLRESELTSDYCQFIRTQGGRRAYSTEEVSKGSIGKKQRNPYLFDDERFAARYTPPPSLHKK